MNKLLIPKIKLKVNKFLNRFLLGKLVGDIPYTIIRDIKEIVYLKEYKNIDVFKKIDESYIEKYNFPKSYPLRFPRDKAFESKYIYSIENAYISTRTGVVWIDNKIFLESIGSMGRLLGWGDVLTDLLMIKSNKTIEESIIICPDTGYYHWLLEVLPNVLHLLKNLDSEVKIAISPKASKYIVTALKYILGDKYANKVLIIDLPTKVKKVYFAYFESQSGFVRKVDRDILKEFFLDEYSIKKERKIYISRAKAPKRSIGNEKEVEKFLMSKGFEIIYAEDLNWLEQIKLYNSANFIIAPHGAGLSNIIWCKKNAKILEIFPYNLLHSCFATLALANNLQYDYITCEKDKNSSGKVNLSLLKQKVLEYE